MNPDVIIIDGRAYSWRRLCELRREQIAARHNARGAQPVLFELHEDYRPATERAAAARLNEPSLLDFIRG
jgi:hypothetical protein